MSANNIIYINRKNYKVYYRGCVDNEGLGELVGRGKTLEEAVDIAQKEIDDCDGMVEYGVWFIGGKNARKGVA